MHRTCSIDFSICVLGVVKMELDGGEIMTLKPGVRFALLALLLPLPPLSWSLFFLRESCVADG